MTRQSTLTNKDHADMDAFLGAVLDDYKAGEITKEQAVGGLAHVLAAIDIGNYGEAINWFRQGRKFVRGEV
ncbi:hypothetical protein [Herbaspirillum sp. RV1423]|uniref:hypothetical protein n=1 Tax=Herbaspirillum sp. RV1423 TaxID=1443993 RepID=UPI0004B80401|nr:hypothetical protein [Herbaspirillum sp. RV1423]